MKQKDICFADLNPTQGREQSGVRPVVVISNNVLNSNLDICIVCPLTSQRKGYAGSVLISDSRFINDDFQTKILS
jgi:mRNA interferase MazF